MHVPRSGSIDNVLCLIDKQCDNEPHKWYMILCQHRVLKSRLDLIRLRYPDMKIMDPVCSNANAIHTWNRFKKDILGSYYKNHFSMTEEQEELFETVFGIQI